MTSFLFTISPTNHSHQKFHLLIEEKEIDPETLCSTWKTYDRRLFLNHGDARVYVSSHDSTFIDGSPITLRNFDASVVKPEDEIFVGTRGLCKFIKTTPDGRVIWEGHGRVGVEDASEVTFIKENHDKISEI